MQLNRAFHFEIFILTPVNVKRMIRRYNGHGRDSGGGRSGLSLFGKSLHACKNCAFSSAEKLDTFERNKRDERVIRRGNKMLISHLRRNSQNKKRTRKTAEGGANHDGLAP